MSKLIKVLMNKDSSCLPIWFMRQAGRYLPEFRKIRSNNKNFIKLCLNAKLSSTITLQPIDKFDLDAAIIFSDILMVPYALNQEVNFEKDKGPILSNFKIDDFLSCDARSFKFKLQPVYDLISITKKKLKKDKSLICFIGAPWTLIIYMFGLKSKDNKLNLDLLERKKKEIKLTLDKLNDYLCLHIDSQMKSGADAVQIFDSWAGMLPEEKINDFCFEPNAKIVNFCKKNNYPVICFPKGINNNYKKFNEIVKPNGIGIDFNVDPEWIRFNLKDVCIQGGMNPRTLLLDDDSIYREAEKYIKTFKDYPYIFNLGHGLLPETNPDKVKKLINFIRENN